MVIHLCVMIFAPFFFLFSTHWTYLELLSVFCEGPSQLQFTICISALNLVSETDKRGRQVEWEWLCGAGWRKSSVFSFQVSTQQHVKRQKEDFFQGYHQTGAVWEEITQRRAGNETLLVTPLSLYLCQEVAFVLKRYFSLFHISFIHAS